MKIIPRKFIMICVGVFGLLILSTTCSSPTLPTERLTATSILVSDTYTPEESPESVKASPTSEATITLTNTIEPTYTSLPTLPHELSYNHVIDLLDNNAGCLLPCWWGFTPGETKWILAKNELDAFVTSIKQGGSGYVTEDGVSYSITNYSVEYEYEGDLTGGQSLYGLKNGIISGIEVGPPSTYRSYQLHQLMSTYGKPEEVFLVVATSTAYGGTPFNLIIAFPSKGIMAMYSDEAKEKGNKFEVCPQDIGPKLWLWSPEEILTLDDLEPLGPGDTFLLKPIDVIPDMDLEAFYDTYKDPGSSFCLDVMAELWQ